jgi:hypothetical protein
MSEKTGRCLCGKVRFVAGDVKTHHHACHCGMCRRWTGGPMMAASVGSMSFEGEDQITRYDSSDWAQRGFCSACGTNLFYFLKSANRYVVSVGAFDEHDDFELVGEIFVDAQPPGYRFAGDLPRQTEQQFLAQFKA